jgi:pimeloyl-ACP methyl ester carboxylesterase
MINAPVAVPATQREASMVIAQYVQKEVQANGLTLRYQEWGAPEAPPIIMLHGFGVSGHMFDEFAQRLQDRYRLISLDQRGHGDSEWSPEGDYSREAFVADLEAVRAALGFEQFILVGHSMGGLNSVSYTVQFPRHVRALVLVDVGPESAREGVDNIVRFTRGPDELEFEQFVENAHRFNQRRTIENIRERMRHRLKPGENGKWTWKFDKRFRQPDSGLRIGGELNNDQTWQLFRDITVPTLLVRGGESDVLSQEVAERAAREMASTTLRVVPGAGHSVPGDNPDDFTFVVRTFLDGLGANPEPMPAETPAGPTLNELVDTHSASRRRPPGSIVVAAGGLALLLAAGAIVYTSGRTLARRRSSKQEADHRGDKAVPATHPSDLEWAHRRALDLVNELAAASRVGVGRARELASEVDVERARSAATDVLRLLGEEGRKGTRRVRSVSSRAASTARSRRTLPRPPVRTLMWLIPLINVGVRSVIANSAKVRSARDRRR